MEISGLLHRLPKSAKLFIFFFTLSLAFGYGMGYKFLVKTTELSPAGIETNYNGNEEDEAATEMKFKKSEGEILTIIHTHAVSMSLLFFALGAIICITSIPEKLKAYLVVEPFVSIICTFGGIWFLWKDVEWMKYVVMISGILMTLSVVLMVLIIIQQTFKKIS
ncbi:hypothetical protein N9R81_03390 [Flavobacteriales bacterium]|nr:hypothetical protein [Flavobacteriales bacterium]